MLITLLCPVARLLLFVHCYIVVPGYGGYTCPGLHLVGRCRLCYPVVAVTVPQPQIPVTFPDSWITGYVTVVIRLRCPGSLFVITVVNVRFPQPICSLVDWMVDQRWSLPRIPDGYVAGLLQCLHCLSFPIPFTDSGCPFAGSDVTQLYCGFPLCGYWLTLIPTCADYGWTHTFPVVPG